MIQKVASFLSTIPFIGFFFEKSFLNYTLIGIGQSILAVFLLWLCIDVMGIPTIISGTIVTGVTFILRYIFYRVFKLM